VLAPATVEDARWMLGSALRDPDPVMLFEHALLYNSEGDFGDPQAGGDIAHARVRRAGDRATVIAYGGTLAKALQAAAELAREGTECEVVDLRVLRPLDEETFLASVRKTGRAVIVDEGWKSGGLAAEVAARIAEHALWDLDAPVQRVCTAEVPLPYAKHLEDAALPQVPAIVAAIRATLGTP
jgi:pyruvate dehydrogenase E1 component beta subunit